MIPRVPGHTFAARDNSPPDRGALRQTLVGAACLSIQPLALNLLSIPALALIIRSLGPDGYAHWMTATALLALFAVITNPGLRGVFVRQLAADPASTSDALAQLLGLRLVLSLVAALLVIAASTALGHPGPVVLCTAIGAGGLALTAVSTTLADVLQARQRFPRLAAINTAAGLTLTAISVLAALLGGGPGSIASAYLAGPALSTLLLLRLVRRQICPVRAAFSIRSARGLLIRMSQFGFFSAGAMVAGRLAVLPDALATAAYPALVKACAQSRRKAARLLALYLGIAIIGGALVSLTVTAAAPFIGGILFPAAGADFVSVLRITVCALPLIGVDLILSYALNAAGKDSANARASLPAAGATLTVSLLLVYAFGIAGASWSFVLRPAIRTFFLAFPAWDAFAATASEHAELIAPGPPARRAA